MSNASTAAGRYADAFAARAPALPGHRLAWLRDMRREAIDAFSRSGFPTPRHEHWKYTNVAPIEKRAFELEAPSSRIVPAGGPGAHVPKGCASPCLVFVDGRVDRDLSDVRALPSGVRIEDFTHVVEHDSGFLEGRLGRIVPAERTAFTALNAAFMDAGAVVRVAPDTDAGAPVHLVFVSGSPECERAYHPRIVIAAGAGARVAVVEHFVGCDDAVYLDNVVTEVEVAEGAAVEHYKVQRASAGAYHVAALQAKLAAGASFHSWAVSLGARLARHDIDVTLDHEHARCSLDGLYVANGRQHVDFHTNVEHVAPQCESREHYKGIAGGRVGGTPDGGTHGLPRAQMT